MICYFTFNCFISITFIASSILFRASLIEPGYRDEFRLGFIFEISAQLPR